MSNEPVWRTNPHDIEPMIATNPNIKGEVHVRILSRTPTVLENTFPPNTWLGRHVHASDTLYIIKEGEFHIEGEGVFRPGDVRFVARPCLRTRVGRARWCEATDRRRQRKFRHRLGLTPNAVSGFGVQPQRVGIRAWARPRCAHHDTLAR